MFCFNSSVLSPKAKTTQINSVQIFPDRIESTELETGSVDYKLQMQ